MNSREHSGYRSLRNSMHMDNTMRQPTKSVASNTHRPTHSARSNMNYENCYHTAHSEVPPSNEVEISTIKKRIEVPEIQILERRVEVPTKVRREKIVQVIKIENVERTIPIEKIQYVDKIIEVPQVEYKEVCVERIIEIPQYQIHVVVKEVEVPVNALINVVEPYQCPVEQTIGRNVPAPVELQTTHAFEMPKIKAIYTDITVPIYVPRYIEVPVPTQFIASVESQGDIGCGSVASVNGQTMRSQIETRRHSLSPNDQNKYGECIAAATEAYKECISQSASFIPQHVVG